MQTIILLAACLIVPVIGYALVSLLALIPGMYEELEHTKAR
jgi:hypothetical protein